MSLVGQCVWTNMYGVPLLQVTLWWHLRQRSYSHPHSTASWSGRPLPYPYLRCSGYGCTVGCCSRDILASRYHQDPGKPQCHHRQVKSDLRGTRQRTVVLQAALALVYATCNSNCVIILYCCIAEMGEMLHKTSTYEFNKHVYGEIFRPSRIHNMHHHVVLQRWIL